MKESMAGIITGHQSHLAATPAKLLGEIYSHVAMLLRTSGMLYWGKPSNSFDLFHEFYQGTMLMETIEIPRFLLDYFDSHTIRTPLSAIRGYADVMLQGAVGPLTEDQYRYLEIIKHNAERLDQHFGIVLHNQHYIVWDEQASPTQGTVRDLMEVFRQVFQHFAEIIITTHDIDETLPVWFDKRHVYNAFVSIGNFINFIQDKNKSAEILVRVLKKTEAVTFFIEFNKTYKIRPSDLPYYESFLYVPHRVLELHGGQFSIKHEAEEKIRLALVFPNL
jgi:His Kinase A (phospho-acceptor) domain